MDTLYLLTPLLLEFTSVALLVRPARQMTSPMPWRWVSPSHTLSLRPPSLATRIDSHHSPQSIVFVLPLFDDLPISELLYLIKVRRFRGTRFYYRYPCTSAIEGRQPFGLISWTCEGGAALDLLLMVMASIKTGRSFVNGLSCCTSKGNVFRQLTRKL